MAPSPNKNQPFPSTLSPTPVCESQPRDTSPTTTTRGTQRGHAELDTPPPGTQPIERRRSDRMRNLSSRALESVAATGKPLAGHSNALQSQAPTKPTSACAEPKSSPKSRPNSSQQPQKRKHASLKFGGEETTDEERAPIRLRPPRNKSKKADSPPPRRPGGHSSAERGSRPAKRGILLNSDAAKSVVKLLGADPRTATTRTINDKILSLSDHRASQVDAQGRYTQVRGETPAPVSPLNQKRGGYHCDKLLALAHPKPTNTKRSLSDGELGPSKRARSDTQPDNPTARNPAFRNDILSLLLFSQRDPASASSTQRVTVHGFRLQHEPCASQAVDRVCFGFGLTPIPEPRDHHSQLNSRRAPSPTRHVPARSLSPKHCALPPPKRHASPDLCASPRQARVLVPGMPSRAPSSIARAPKQACVLVPGTPSQSLSPDRHAPKPLPAKHSRSDTRKPPPVNNPDSATESETEPEPVPQPKSKRNTRQIEVARAGERPSWAVAELPTHHRRRTPPRQWASPAPPSRQRDVQSILDRLGNVLNGGDSGDVSDDPIIDQDQSSPSRHERNRPSSSRHESQPSTSRRAHNDTSLCNDEPRHQSGKKACRAGEDSMATESGSDSPTNPTRNGLSRYPGKRGKVALHAIPHLLSVAIHRGAYQPQDVYFKWARQEYIRAWKKLYPKVKYKHPPRHLLRLMILRISGLRTDIKKRVRSLMARLHHLRNPGSSERRLEHNQRLCWRLLPNTFHCSNLVADEGYYEHEHLSEVISEALFSHPDCPVIQHYQDYKLMPLPAVALVLTNMQDCLQEWDTGCLRVRDNHFRQQKPMFDAHLHGLQVYEGKARTRLAGLRSRWFLARMEYAGIRVVEGTRDEDNNHEFCQPVTQACFIALDTDSDSSPDPEPEPEPEPELISDPEYNEYGYVTAKSKGKGKAKGLADGDLDGPEDDLEDDREDDFELDHDY